MKMQENQISNEAFQDIQAGVKDCFLNVLRSCFGENSEQMFLQVKRLCREDFRDTLNSEIAYNAYEVLCYMKSAFEQMDIFPSAVSFAAKFADYKGITPLNGRLPQELNDDISRIERFVQNSIFARKLFAMASDVRLTGITMETLNLVQTMYDETHKINDPQERDYKKEAEESAKEGIYRLYVDPIDRLTRGFHKGYITTIAAYAGGCKTTWALNAALHNALEGLHVVYMSFEVSSDQMWSKLMSIYSFIRESPIGRKNAIPVQDILSYNLTPTQKKNLDTLDESWKKKIRPNLTLLDETDIAETDMEEDAVRQLLYTIDDRHPIDLLVIDHITFLKFYNGHGRNPSSKDEYGKLNNYVAFFRKLATSFRIKDEKPRKLGVILLSQINRKGYEAALKNIDPNSNSTQGRYTMTALAEANELDRSSGYVLSIFKSSSSDTALIQLLKNRNGEICEVGVDTQTNLRYGIFGNTENVSNEDFKREVCSNMSAQVETKPDDLNNESLEFGEIFTEETLFNC